MYTGVNTGLPILLKVCGFDPIFRGDSLKKKVTSGSVVYL
jgi:hypothetical protein